jgi:hypothetical protein
MQSKLQPRVQLKELVKLIRITHFIGCQTRYLPACSIVHWPLRYRVSLYLWGTKPGAHKTFKELQRNMLWDMTWEIENVAMATCWSFTKMQLYLAVWSMTDRWRYSRTRRACINSWRECKYNFSWCTLLTMADYAVHYLVMQGKA